MNRKKKGDKTMIKLEDTEIGEFIGQLLQQVTIDKIKQFQLNPKLLNVLLEKNSPKNSLILCNGFSFWCVSGEIDLDKTTFLNHVKRKHQNIVPIQSQINRPFWFDWIFIRQNAHWNRALYLIWFILMISSFMIYN